METLDNIISFVILDNNEFETVDVNGDVSIHEGTIVNVTSPKTTMTITYK